MRTNRVKQALREGRTAVGTWLTLASPLAAEILAGSGLDWLMVDLEHSPAGPETAALMIGAVAHRGIAPLVRVPGHGDQEIKRALDAGAFGTLVPMVNSVEEAEAAVAASRYPPQGRRSVGGSLRAVRWDADPATYLERANDEVLVIVQAEHRLHLERAEAIAAVPGVDVVFIGPNDFSASLGHRRGDPAMEAAYAQVLAACRRAGVAAGFHAADAEEARLRLGQGFRFVAVGSDSDYLTRTAAASLRAVADLRAQGAG